MRLFLLTLAILFCSSLAFAPNGFPVSCRKMFKSSLDMKLTGKVKFFDSTKGFGFIAQDNGGDDVFVHQSVILAQGFRSLADGEPVEFDVATDPAKGDKKYAINVTGPNGAYVQGAPRKQYGEDF